MKKSIVLFAFLIISSFTINKAEEPTMQSKHTVVVTLEAKSGKEDRLIEELLKVKKLSEQESACLEYHVHQDINNPTKILLYENWTSKEDHAKQFEKPYILGLVDTLKDVLAKPYEAVFAKELS